MDIFCTPALSAHPARCQRQSGNALFLILIAVALFAALSYAITQSSRGDGNVRKEQDILDAARLTQFGAAVQAAATRLIITGTAVTALRLCPPVAAAAGACVAPNTSGPCTTGDACVFAPEGGGVPAGSVPVLNGKEWLLLQTGGFASSEVDGIGQSGCGAACQDIFGTVEVTESICNQINKSLGLSHTPVAQDANSLSDLAVDAYPGQAAFCYSWVSGPDTFYNYVHVFVER